MKKALVNVACRTSGTTRNENGIVPKISTRTGQAAMATLELGLQDGLAQLQGTELRKLWLP